MTELATHYNPALVTLSVVIAIVSSFVALAVVPRIYDPQANRKSAFAWALVFGVSLGAGIWLMHFVAMLALELPVPVRYGTMLTLVSLVVGIGFVTLGALPLLHGGRLDGLRLLRTGVLVGAGVAAMHYTGMAAMRMAATAQYDLPLVAVSLLVAVVAATAALWIANRLRRKRIFSEVALKLFAAVVMGIAVSAMHYTGMAAVHFYPQADMAGPLSGLDKPLLVVVLTVIAVLVQGGVLIMAVLDESGAATRRQLVWERRMTALLNSIPDAVFAVDSQGLIQQANPAALRLFGYPLDAITGMGIHSLLPEDIHGQKVRLRGTDGHDDGVLHEICGQRRDGSLFPCELSLSASGGGSFSAVVRDISIRKQVEAESQRLRVAMQQTQEGVLITDHEGRVIYANPAVAVMAGLAPDALLIGKLAAELRGGTRGDAQYQTILSRLNRGKPWQGELRLALPGGTTRIVERHIAPVIEDGVTRYHVCIDSDVTENRQQQQKIEHRQRLESLGVLAGGVAHDFNNILAVIMGNAELARMDMAADDPQRSYMDRITDASQRATELCKQMLDYSGKGSFLLKTLRLSDLVRESSGMLDMAVAKNVTLQFRFQDEQQVVTVDVAQLRQVVMNLLINASEAMEGKPGVVTCCTGMMHADQAYLNSCQAAEDSVPGQFLFLEVVDTGSGMDERTQKKLFEPFFTTKFTGRGLGMSAVLGIMRSHHGAIHTVSTVGKGSRFRVLLPVAEALVARETKEDRLHDWHGSGTVLVVDDEAAIRDMATRLLQTMGFDTLTAGDGEQGVAMYRQHQDEIVAVLLDMSMPRLDGNGCFQALCRINGTVRVLFSSGYSEQDVDVPLTGNKQALFIHKPYTFDMMRMKMKEILGRNNE